ncbi:MAG: glycosyltransferase family 9 protein, partial [Rhodospirillales bacterium]
ILTNLGLANSRLGDVVAARACHDQALVLDPHCVDALINRGNLQERCDDIAGAVADLTAARELAPGNPDILNNLGFACLSGNRTDAARQALKTALSLSPEQVEAAVNLAHLDLLTGDFAAGWRGYEARRRQPGWRVAVPDCPEWRGEEISGRTVLVVCEQGYGDTIQFARHVIDLLDRGASVDLCADACIADLLTTVPGVGKVISDVTDGGWDFWIPAMSLPLRLGLDGPPGIAASYLTAPRTVVTLTRGTGFCFRGNSRHRNDARRSLSPDLAASFLNGRGETFVSLNHGVAAGDDALPAGMRGRDDIEDFTDLARIVAGLDLVISVDTAVAHLAGALGRPCWLLLPFSPDWRWGLASEMTPLYPEMRLFRQSAPGDWDGVLARVNAELDKRS